jgi:nicotinamidase-related amidase
MLISQTFRGTPTLDQKGYYLLQKWHRLTNETKQEIIKGVADGLRLNTPGTQIKDELARAINQAVTDADIAKLNY